MSVFTDEFRTTWRRQTGLTGFVVEWVVWMTVLAAVLQILTWLLMGTAWVLGRVA